MLPPFSVKKTATLGPVDYLSLRRHAYAVVYAVKKGSSSSLQSTDTSLDEKHYIALNQSGRIVVYTLLSCFRIPSH